MDIYSRSLFPVTVPLGRSIHVTNHNLVIDKTTIYIAGTGTLEVTAEDLLDIAVCGAATIR